MLKVRQGAKPGTQKVSRKTSRARLPRPVRKTRLAPLDLRWQRKSIPMADCIEASDEAIANFRCKSLPKTS